MHADASQVATLLLDSGSNGRPKLNEVDASVAIGDLSSMQVAIAGHSLGGAWLPAARLPDCAPAKLRSDFCWQWPGDDACSCCPIGCLLKVYLPNYLLV